MLRLGRCVIPRARAICQWWVASRYTHHRTLANANLLNDLSSRGLIAEITSPERLKDALRDRQVVYSGIDPTATSLHIGHLLPMLCLLHFQIRGHQVISLIGGATGLIGDPSGRSIERKPADIKVVEQNVEGLKAKVEMFFIRALQYAEARLPSSQICYQQPSVLNNIEWFQDMNLLEFLRTVGVSVRVNTMLNRESVQTRLESQQGISFTEFSYQLLQAYDFYTLYRRYGCSVQIGGSDQWGNILAGLELINRLDDFSSGQALERREKGFCITTPLLTTDSGEKFGKSAGNAIWLDEQSTSVFDFYQFFLKTADADVEKYLKMFTLLSITDVEEIVKRHQATPEKRIAQRLLADELTELVHTQDGLRRAHAMTKILFDTDYSELKAQDVISELAGDPRLVFCDEIQLFSTSITRLTVAFKLLSSSAASRNLVKSGGLYVNNRPIRDVHFKVGPADLLDGRMVVVRAGRDKHLIFTLN